MLALGTPGYPALLAQISDPPLLLYIKGRLPLLDGPCLAIVGSRNASNQGKANALAFAEALSAAGVAAQVVAAPGGGLRIVARGA